MKKLTAEFFGTFWLVLGGCGAAVLAGDMIGWLGVALAFGLTVMTMAFAVGHISGGHFNPAVSLGLFFAGRFDGKLLPGYIVAQVLGGLAGMMVIYAIVSGQNVTTFAANGYDALSPKGYGLTAALITEFVMTFFFLFIIIGATSRNAPAGFAPIAIGLGLTLIHLISIAVTNTSVNPARSIASAAFQGGESLTQLWVFIAAPIAGGITGGIVARFLQRED